ncbi:unnamed protein product, partial [Tuber aestivum]
GAPSGPLTYRTGVLCLEARSQTSATFTRVTRSLAWKLTHRFLVGWKDFPIYQTPFCAQGEN